MTKQEAEEAVISKNLVLCDYLNNNEYTLGVLTSNPDNCDLIMTGKLYQNNTNLIGIYVAKFSDNASLCVTFRDDNKSVIASTTYLSDFPSCFFLNKKAAEN